MDGPLREDTPHYFTAEAVMVLLGVNATKFAWLIRDAHKKWQLSKPYYCRMPGVDRQGIPRERMVTRLFKPESVTILQRTLDAQREHQGERTRKKAQRQYCDRVLRLWRARHADRLGRIAAEKAAS